ncbi:hypothetical protein [Glaciibacter superstes]|uniref:hypothetical protein n=1 Tax=Glaciibacter superstes TaxID=501023 RepID=UPI0003B50F82|nr:hypothetical protein [Glaciibacter superstes]
MDRAESVVHSEGGGTLRFRALVVSAGGTPQPTMGDGVGGVFTLHSAFDAVRIREHIGTEFAGP